MQTQQQTLKLKARWKFIFQFVLNENFLHVQFLYNVLYIHVEEVTKLRGDALS